MRLAVVLIFKFFASLKLAIFLLLSLALVFAVGTFIESAYGAEAAKLVVYQSPWMGLLLILLALNVAAAALDRLPWKKKHVGFVVTHTGILLILVGALVTRAFGVEGQMAIQEGQTVSRIILDEAMLQIFPSDSGPIRSFRIPPRAFPWQGRQELDSDVSVLHYYPKASRKEKIEEATNGPAAIQVVLQSSWMKVNHWLVLDDAQRERILLGPAELRFTRERMVPFQKMSGEGFLEFQFEHSTVKLPLGQDLSKKLSLQGTPYQVTILRVLKDAVVDQGQLIDRSDAWNNPACELMLEGPGLREKHTLFSKYPDFPTMHGMKPSQAVVRIFYRRPEEAGNSGPQNELRFVWQEENLPLYQIRKSTGVSEGAVRVGEEYETGWMDFKFRVEHYYPHARVSAEWRGEPVSSQSDEYLSAVQIGLANGGETKLLWLGQGDRDTVMMGGRSFQVVYGLSTQPIGFRITLRDFRVENYPGTNRPASFESDVTLKDDSTGTVRDVNIRMNHPLEYRGYRIFQSGYQQPEGMAEISIFTVAKDPGVPLKYGGALVLIAGILIMFYTRRFSSHPIQSFKEAAILQ